MEVRIKAKTIEEIEEIVEGRMAGIPIAAEMRSAHRIIQPTEVLKDLCEAGLISRLVESCKQKGKDSKEVSDTNNRRYSSSQRMYISNNNTNKEKWNPGKSTKPRGASTDKEGE